MPSSLIGVSKHRIVYVLDRSTSTFRAIDRLGKDHCFETQTFQEPSSLLKALGKVTISANGDLSRCLIFDSHFIRPLRHQVVAAQVRGIPKICLARGTPVVDWLESMQMGLFEVVVMPFRLFQMAAVIQRALSQSTELWRESLERESIARGLTRLTNRERQICDLVAQGLSSKLISRKLGISEKTVYVHRTHLLQKIGLRSSARLARLSQALSPYAFGLLSDVSSSYGERGTPSEPHCTHHE